MRHYFNYSQPRIFRLAIDRCSHCGTYRTTRRLHFWQQCLVGYNKRGKPILKFNLLNIGTFVHFSCHISFQVHSTHARSHSHHKHTLTHTWCISIASAQMLFSALAWDVHHRSHLARNHFHKQNSRRRSSFERQTLFFHFAECKNFDLPKRNKRNLSESVRRDRKSVLHNSMWTGLL